MSAIATIVECCRTLSCAESVAEISPSLAQFLALCIQSYHGRNLLIALDATEQLAMCCNISSSAHVRIAFNLPSSSPYLTPPLLQAIIPPLIDRWNRFAQIAASVSYDPSQMPGGDMCVSMFRTFTSISNSVGPQVFSSCLEAIIYPSVQRLAAAVKTDGESEYFEEDTLWDSFSTNFVEFLENVALLPNPQCTDIFIRHDLLSCIMRLITVRYRTLMFFLHVDLFLSGSFRRS